MDKAIKGEEFQHGSEGTASQLSADSKETEQRKMEQISRECVGQSTSSTSPLGSGQQSSSPTESGETSDVHAEQNVVDSLVNRALQDEDGSGEDDDDFLSATDGEDDDDEKIEEWGETLAQLSNDTSTFSQADAAASQGMCNIVDSVEDSEEKEELLDSEQQRLSAESPVLSETEAHTHSHSDKMSAGDNNGSGGNAGKDCDETDENEENAGQQDEEKEVDEKDEDEEKIAERKRQEEEDALTEEERQARLEEAVKVKVTGNEAFKQGQYAEAMEHYSQGLQLCPLKYVHQRSIMLSNRAACHVKKEDYQEAVTDCSKAIELQPTYLKAINRRADAYEKLEKLDDALKDHQKILELDRSQAASYHACMRLEKEINERNEKMKEEMMGKLKELGNMVLRPFGLSTSNFQLNQDPNSGGYSVQFVNSPPTNGH